MPEYEISCTLTVGFTERLEAASADEAMDKVYAMTAEEIVQGRQFEIEIEDVEEFEPEYGDLPEDHCPVCGELNELCGEINDCRRGEQDDD